MTIDALPTPPSRGDAPATFITNADAFLAALPTFRTQANALAAAMNAVAAGTALAIPLTFSTTTTDADPGSGNLRLDNSTQNAATTIRTDLIGSDGSDWTNVLALFDDSTSSIKGYITLKKQNDGTKFLLFSVSAVASPSGYRNITVSNVAYSAASPFADGDAIVLEFTRNGDKGDTGDAGSISVPLAERTSNTILGSGDKSKLIKITSGTFTQTFDACATLGADWFIWLWNAGTGDVTLDPSGAEQIDGLTSFVMYPGEARLIQCNGAKLTSIVLSPFKKTFSSSGTFTKPPGYNEFGGLLWGAGASGAKSSSGVSASGGGGGACVPFCLGASALAATETVTIGSGGAAVSASATVGNAGGNSSLGSLVTAYGGGGGFQNGGTNNLSGGGGGGAFSAGSAGSGSTAGGGHPNTGGSNNSGFGGGNSTPTGPGDSAYGGGGGGNASSAASPMTGGKSLYGGGGGGGTGSSSGAAAGGASTFGGSGGAGSIAGSGTAGTAPGGGGGATQTGVTSGAGARGELQIWGIA